jgi:DNA-binding ferritin-like protein
MNLIESIHDSKSSAEEQVQEVDPIVQLISDLKFLETQFKFYHWNTQSSTEHKYYDEIVDGFAKYADTLAEIYIGITSSPISPMIVDKLTDYHSKKEAITILQTMLEYIMEFPETVGSIKNVLDELEGFIARYVYLLSLNP